LGIRSMRMQHTPLLLPLLLLGMMMVQHKHNG
jgi:hypothetical protein